jgi:hypothetical protein
MQLIISKVKHVPANVYVSRHKEMSYDNRKTKLQTARPFWEEKFVGEETKRQPHLHGFTYMRRRRTATVLSVLVVGCYEALLLAYVNAGTCDGKDVWIFLMALRSAPSVICYDVRSQT